MFRILLEVVFLVILAGGLTLYVVKRKPKTLTTPRRKKIPKPGDPEYLDYLQEQLEEEDRKLQRLKEFDTHGN